MNVYIHSLNLYFQKLHNLNLSFHWANVNDVHYEGKMIQCNYLLRWQLANGEIIERYSNIVSASKYDVGETGNSTLVLSSNFPEITQLKSVVSLGGCGVGGRGEILL